MASETKKLISERSSAKSAVVPGVWHAGFSKCKSYATSNKVPLIAVWSNGDSCGHCVLFESAVNSSYFKKWMKTSGCVFYFIYSGDGGDGKVGSDVFHWCRKKKNVAYPFVRIYWPSGGVDIATIGDTLDGQKDGTKGGKKSVAYLKKKLKKFFDQPASSVPDEQSQDDEPEPDVPDEQDESDEPDVQPDQDDTPDGHNEPDIVDPDINYTSSISSLTSPSNRFKKLKIDAKKHIMFSNNVVEIDVVSSLTQADIDKSLLTHIRLGTNVSALLPSCFVECENLSAVHMTSTKLKDIGNRAFYGCKRLTNVTCLSSGSNAKLYNIGLSAFARSGLTNVNISLSGTSTGTQIQGFAFAECPNLTSMTNVGSNYLADYEFNGCSALQQINLANSHSFFGKYVFKDCISLSNAVIPPKTYMIGEGCFQGCTSLTNVTFLESDADPSQLNYDNCLHNYMLSGTALTSLVLPSSITSYTQIEPYAFTGLDKLCSIQFNGMTYNQIATNTKTEKSIKYEFGYVYTDSSKNIWGSSKVSGYKYTNYFKTVKNKALQDMASYCLQKSIPLAVFAGGASCGSCQMFKSSMLRKPQFLNWLKSSKCKCMIIYTQETSDWAYQTLLPKITSSPDSYHYVGEMCYWKSGSTVKKYYNSGIAEVKTSSAIKNITSRLESLFKSYSRPADVTQVISADIYNSGCFGLYHDVTLYANDGKNNVTYVNGSASRSQALAYQSQKQVDKITINDFKYGQWYYNAIELKSFADAHEIPVFALLESTACGPCEEFKKVIFNNASFQALMASKKILLCKCEDSTFVEDEISFLANTWMTQATESDPNGYAPGVMPVMMLYWYRKKGATNGQIDPSTGEPIYVPSTYKVYAHYNSAANASNPESCPHLSSFNAVIDWINENCPDEASMDYHPSSTYDLPQITSYVSSTDYPRYNVYTNQVNDTYGRYYPVNHLRAPESYEVFDVQIKNCANQQLNGDFSQKQTPAIPPGTYQYFTMLSTGNPQYDTTYDISGILFQINGDMTYSLVSSDSDIDPNQHQSFDSYISQLGIDDDHIISQSSSFMDFVYMYDEDDHIIVNEEEIDAVTLDENGTTYNISVQLSLDDMKIDGNIYNTLYAYLSSSIITADEDGPFKPDGDIFMVSCNLYNVQISPDSSLQWLSVFNNA